MKTKWKVMAALLGAAGMTQAAYVTIGDPGNDPDGTYGAVGYTYKISATEVTIAEFAASGAGNDNENYWNDGTTTSVGTNAPASNVSLYEAMKYCNWLTSDNILNGAYNFDGSGNYLSTDRASAISTYGTIYALPTEDEWYKAAYYTGNSGDLWSLYANGNELGTVPTEGGGETGWNYNNVNSSPNYTRDTALGSNEQNGTVNMMGNVWEWMEDSAGVIRGGSYGYTESTLRSSTRYGYNPSYQNNNVGFRPVEVVPEPSTVLLLAAGGCIAWLARLKQRL